MVILARWQKLIFLIAVILNVLFVTAKSFSESHHISKDEQIYPTMNTKMILEKLLPGDVFATRNIGSDESQNESPGFFNHLAIYVGDGIVVESQADFGVCKFKVENFEERYPIIVVLRHNKTDVAESAAKHALSFVGQPYRKLSSIFRFPRSNKGFNCVSVVRQAYLLSTKEDWLYTTPDNLFFDIVHFQEIDRKWDRNWVAPKNLYDGKID